MRLLLLFALAGAGAAQDARTSSDSQASFERAFQEADGAASLRAMDDGDVQANYRASGAAVYFLMHFDGGRYRGDFLQLLRDAYNGTPRPIEEYFGLTQDSLRLLMSVSKAGIRRIRGRESKKRGGR